MPRWLRGMAVPAMMQIWPQSHRDTEKSLVSPVSLVAEDLTVKNHKVLLTNAVYPWLAHHVSVGTPRLTNNHTESLVRLPAPFRSVIDPAARPFY